MNPGREGSRVTSRGGCCSGSIHGRGGVQSHSAEPVVSRLNPQGGGGGRGSAVTSLGGVSRGGGVPGYEPREAG